MGAAEPTCPTQTAQFTLGPRVSLSCLRVLLKMMAMLGEMATLLLLLLLGAGPATLRAEKLSVLLPGQGTEFDLEHEIDVSSGPSPPGTVRSPTATPPLVLDAPPAILPTFPPAPKAPVNGQGANVRIQVPSVNALYDVPSAETSPQTTRDTCLPQTVRVTLRDTIVSTRVSVSEVFVPTTVIQRLTTTRTSVQTSSVTVQGPVQIVTTEVEQPAVTVFVTSTQVQQQVVTTTRLQVRTQVVTSSVVESLYVTQTVTTPLVETEVSTQLEYVTTVQYVNTCSSSSSGYSYPAPYAHGGVPSGGSYTAYPSSGSGRPGYGGYYGTSEGHQGHFYGPYYARPVSYVRQSRKKGLFGKWGF